MDRSASGHSEQPFIESVVSVFRTMLKQPVEAGGLRAEPAIVRAEDIRAMVRLGGEVSGSVTVVMGEAPAVAAIDAFVGHPTVFGGAEFRDAIGELANMIAGSAASQLPGRRVTISCPSVLIGPGQPTTLGANATRITIPFTFAAGSFAVEVILADAEGAAKAA